MLPCFCLSLYCAVMNRSQGFIFVIFIVLVSIPIFGHLDSLPIQLWDESRLANNAYEMLVSKNWLIPTFGFSPDMWSAKPPMMIWLQALSTKCLGMSELAIRLPAALAAFALCIFIFRIFAKRYKQPLAGLLICLVLVTAQGYVRTHCIRTGDYDSLLTMFTIMYCLYYFLFLEEQQTKYLYIAALLFICGAYTKGIAIFIPLPGLLLYTIADKKLFYLLRNKHFYFTAVSSVALIITYYLVREHYNPGYIAEVQDNEIGGRYLYATVPASNRYEDMLFYARYFISRNFIYWYLWIPVGLVLAFTRSNPFKKIVLFSFISGLSYFLIVSKSLCKNEWYDMVTYPFAAIIVGTGIFQISSVIKDSINNRGLKHILPTLFVIIVFFIPYKRIMQKNEERDINNDNSITFYLKDLLHKDKMPKNIAIAYNDYRADILWYSRAFMSKACSLDQPNRENLQPGEKIIVYQDDIKKFIEERYTSRIVETFYNVTVYEIAGRKL